MSDNLRRYLAIRNALRQWYPTSLNGHQARHLLTSTSARDLEITAQNLESVFLTLTAEPSASDLVSTGARR